MCSETSPRISFSNDLGNGDGGTEIERRDTALLDSDHDFEFNISTHLLDHDPSLADELFCNGILLPFQDNNKREETPLRNVSHDVSRNFSLPPLPSSSSSSSSSTTTNTASRSRSSTIISSDSRNKVNNSTEIEEKAQSKSTFWGFKRSSSLNCDIRKSLIFSLPLLSRSNSTGSSLLNSKKSSMGKKSSGSSSGSSSATSYVYAFPNSNSNNNNKPPLKKKYGGGPNCNKVVKVSPILNVPPPYIAKGAANLFGLGSLLRNGKEKNRK